MYPGETVVTNMWVSGNKVIVESSTKERGKAIFQGFAELQEAPKL